MFARVRTVLLLASIALGASTARAQAVVGPLLEARVSHAAVTLRDGRVLVAGGQGAGRALLASVELMAGARWIAAAPLSDARSGLALTLLTDGRVLATGGRAASGPVATVELWDPATERWSAAAPMRDGRAYHAAVRLSDGRVLVAGGQPSGSGFWTASAEVWDPARDVWTRVAPMTAPRRGGTAERLGDGRVLVSGHYLGAERADDLDLYDPARDAWTSLRASFGQLEAAVALPDGRALVLGHGRPSRYVADSRDARAAIWDPTSNGWTDIGSVGYAPWPRHASVVALPSGDVVVGGGTRWEFPSRAAERRAFAEACEGVHVPLRSVAEVRVWNARGVTWRRVADLRQPRSVAAATLVGTDTVLLTGGERCRYDDCAFISRGVDRVRP